MKQVLFTIIAILSFGITAEAQKTSAVIRQNSELSLDNAIQINFEGNGTVISHEATITYAKSLKSDMQKSFETAANETYYSSTQITTVSLPIAELIPAIIKANAASYFGNAYTISATNNTK